MYIHTRAHTHIHTHGQKEGHGRRRRPSTSQRDRLSEETNPTDTLILDF